MSFKTGSISFRIFKLSRSAPETEELAEKLAAAALPPLNTIADESVHGWCGHSHAMDRCITVDNICMGSHLHFQLIQAARRVPAMLLHCECAVEEKAVMEAEGFDYLSQTRRSEIKKQVRERLLLDQQPVLRSIEITMEGDYLYATACSESQLDMLVLSLLQTTGIALKALDPDEAALHLTGVDVRNFPQKSLSAAVLDVQSDITAGREFLTWLWYCSEKRGGLINTAGHGEIAYMVEGPLDFVLEGRGAHEVIIKRGEPMLAGESKAALQAGKTLKSARVMFVRGEDVWSFKLDADLFVFRGLKLPQTEAFECVGRFQERMIFLEAFRSVFFELYKRYLEERTSSWDVVSAEIRHWVADRPASV